MRQYICIGVTCLMVACKPPQQQPVAQSALPGREFSCSNLEVPSPLSGIVLRMRKADLNELMDIAFQETPEFGAYTEIAHGELSGSIVNIGLNGDAVVTAEVLIPCDREFMRYLLGEEGWKPMGLWSAGEQ